MRRATAVSLTCILLMLVMAPTIGGFDKFKNAPGKYKDVEDIDQLQIMQAFNVADYTTLIVAAFDNTATPLPEKSDNTWVPVQRTLKMTTTTFTLSLDKTLDKVLTVKEAEGGAPPATPKTLLLRAKVVEMNPGSRAARYFAGFGAGKASVVIGGEMVDAATNQVLFSFQSTDYATGMGSGAGGDYESVLNACIKVIGERVGDLLKLFKNA